MVKWVLAIGAVFMIAPFVLSFYLDNVALSVMSALSFFILAGQAGFLFLIEGDE